MSPTPPAGGATPVPTAPGNIKVIRVGPDGQPDSSAAITIPQTDLEKKKRMGYRVAENASAGASSAGSMGGGFGPVSAGSIMNRKPRKKNEFESEEPAEPAKKPQPGRWATRKNGQKYWQYEGLSEEESKGVAHCSQCGKGFSSAGLKPPHHTGFSHCKDHKGMRIVAEGLTIEPRDKEEPTQQKSISNINTQRAVKQGATPKVDTKIDEQEPEETPEQKRERKIQAAIKIANKLSRMGL
jgi:hypothetical protein